MSLPPRGLLHLMVWLYVPLHEEDSFTCFIIYKIILCSSVPREFMAGQMCMRDLCCCRLQLGPKLSALFVPRQAAVQIRVSLAKGEMVLWALWLLHPELFADQPIRPKVCHVKEQNDWWAPGTTCILDRTSAFTVRLILLSINLLTFWPLDLRWWDVGINYRANHVKQYSTTPSSPA